MNFLMALAIPVLLIWAIVVFRSNRWALLKPWMTYQNLMVVSLIAGCCLGYEFFHLSVGPIPATIDRIFWGAMMCLFGFFIYKNQIRLRPFNHLDLFVLGLLLFIAFSTFSHDWKYRGNEPMGRLLFFNLMPAGFYLVARNIKFEAKHFQQAFWLFSLFGIYLALTAIAEVRGWSFLVWPRYIADPSEAEFFGRARGPMMNPVANGMAMMFALGSTLILWPNDTSKLKLRIYVASVSVLLTVGIVATMTRSVWLGLPVIFFALVWLPAPNRLRGGMAIAAMVILALGISLFGSKFNSFQRDKYVTASEMSESASLRPMLAFVAFKMFEDRPIMGCGFGQYTKYKRVYHLESGSGMPLQKVLVYMQHNIVLSYLTELGLIGVAFLLAITITSASMAFRIWRRFLRGAPEPDSTGYFQFKFSTLMMVMVICWMTNGMFHDVSIIPMVGSFMYFLFGMINGTYEQTCLQARPDVEPRTAQTATRVAIG